ncbi:MAG: molybdopterin molybdotransferase MoeA [Gammaproteobacteria bacterium]|nr:molybdopterin molybdotransferase MoeA [Gammaproteobacteria bacterium]
MKTPIPVTLPPRDERDPGLLSVEQAQQQIHGLLTPVTAIQDIALHEAFGRILAQDLSAPINVPPYANSAMDGYALCGSDIPASGSIPLSLVGTSWAGKPFTGRVNTGQCVRIMTGAKIPEGTDTIVMQEQAQRLEQQITISSGHQTGQHVRHPGEDIRQGSVLLPQGKKIGAAEWGLLASQGIAQLPVYQRLRVAFFSTGDELRPVGEPLQDGQIYDSNRYTLTGMLLQAGVELIDLGVIADELTAIENAMHSAAKCAEVIITTGGVSVGDADYVKQVLQQLGQVNFWRIAMKPGKPLALGKIGPALFFGLPGNPVSVMATFYQFVLPALRAMSGETARQPLVLKAVARARIKKVPGRTDFQRGVLTSDNGKLFVDTTGIQASHVLSGMSRANCFIVLPRDCGNIEAGAEVEVQPFSEFL